MPRVVLSDDEPFIKNMDDHEIDRRKKALDRYLYEMANNLSPVAMALVMYMKMSISQSEYSSIRAEQDPQKQVTKLIDSVRSRPHIFEEFCSAIDEMNHSSLAMKLRCKYLNCSN